MLPSLHNLRSGTWNQITRFGGYTHLPAAGDGAIVDMTNLSARDYPLLATRKKRRHLQSLQSPGGIGWHGELCLVEGSDFLYGGVKKGEVTPGEKTFVSVNNYLIILPDLCYYHTKNDTYGKLAEEIPVMPMTIQQANGAVTLVGENAEAYASMFFPGDTVTITASIPGYPMEILDVSIASRQGTVFLFENWKPSVLTSVANGSIGIKRRVPEMDFLCECDNRLFGCRGSHIYASALGEPLKWYTFEGLSTDSYAVDVGTEGDFTACCSYLNMPIFFKEHSISKLYGSKPTDYQVMTTQTLGVASGSERSLAVVGETLFYHSPRGFAAMKSGSVSRLNDVFGERLHGVVGGGDGARYYASVLHENEKNSLMVFDLTTGLWHREDETRVLGFVTKGHDLYGLTVSGVWLFGDVNATGGVEEGEITSSVTFADMSVRTTDRKIVRKVEMRIEADAGSRVTVFLRRDGGDFFPVRVLSPIGKQMYAIPLLPGRADHFAVRIEALGAFRLYALSVFSSPGSNL